MARRTTLASDLTGREIDDKSAARIVITFGDARKGRVLDVNENEISDLISKGSRQARRGRKPKVAA